MSTTAIRRLAATGAVLAISLAGLAACGGPKSDDVIEKCLDTWKNDMWSEGSFPTGKVIAYRAADKDQQGLIALQAASGENNDPHDSPTVLEGQNDSMLCTFDSDGNVSQNRDVNSHPEGPESSKEADNWNNKHAEQWASDNLEGINLSSDS